MGKFSKDIDPYAVSTQMQETRNYEGGKSYTMTPQTELYTRVASWLVKEPKFYGEVSDETERISYLIGLNNTLYPEWLLQLAAFARNELHLRSAPIFILAQAAILKNPFVRRYTPAIVRRADELSEVISILVKRSVNLGDKSKGTMLPNGLRRGLADTFPNFSRYEFQKYNRKPVTMQDVIRLVHPDPRLSRREDSLQLYDDIASDNLGSANTWETLISGSGSTTENWEKAARIMPIMATLRNLRNLLDNNCSHETFDFVIQKLTDEKTILNSKQFPFRFFSAYKSIENNSNPQTGRLLTALNIAIDISIKNLPKFDGVTAVFADNSGSMSTRPISENSTIYPRDIANIFTAIASKLSPVNVVGSFADEFVRCVNFADQDSVLHRMAKVGSLNVGSSTNAYLAIQYLIDNNIKVDRIFIFSDEQTYDSNGYGGSVVDVWQRYKRKYSNTFLYSVDLTGYGTSQVPEDDPKVLKIAGWSESILKYIPFFEKDSSTVIESIGKINPNTYKQ